MLHYLYNYFLDLSPQHHIVIRKVYLLLSLYGRGLGVGLFYFLITVTSPFPASLMMLEGT